MPASSPRPLVDGAAPSRRRRGRWVPWLFVAAFAAVAAANGILVWLAVGSFSGLATDRPYERGLSHNRSLAEARAQAALGWRVEVWTTPLPGNAVEVSAQFADRAGHAIDDLAVTASFRRPIVTGHDVDLPLVAAGGGRYRATTRLALPGQWDLRLVARGGGRTWRAERRFQTP